MKKHNRLQIKEAILEKLKQGGEYTYNSLRVLGASTGLVSSIIHSHLLKQCKFRTERTGPEDWQRTIFISWNEHANLLATGKGRVK